MTHFESKMAHFRTHFWARRPTGWLSERISDSEMAQNDTFWAISESEMRSDGQPVGRPAQNRAQKSLKIFKIWDFQKSWEIFGCCARTAQHAQSLI